MSIARKIIGESEHSETNLRNPEEKRELSIANDILKAVSSLPDSAAAVTIKARATELKNMHVITK